MTAAAARKTLILFAVILPVVFLFACSEGTPPAGFIASADLPEAQREESYPILIAHAGGAADGFTGTNSYEALNNSAAAGYRYIEVDFLLSADGVPVLNHDWEFMTGRVPGAPNVPVLRSVFLGYDIFDRYTPADLDMLIEFLDKHPDIRIVTDTKDDDYTVLEIIASEYPAHIGRFIPQAYAFEDIAHIKSLGFSDVIVTLYKMPEDIINNGAKAAALINGYRDELFGVTIFDGLLKPEFIAGLDLTAARFFAHTINSKTRAEELINLGFAGVYTDFLYLDGAGGLGRVSDVDINQLITEANNKYNALDLPEADKRALDAALIYKRHTPVYMAYGEARPINDELLTVIFTRYKTDELYLPVVHFGEFMRGYEWERWETDPTALSLTITVDENTVYHYETNDTDGPLIFRSIPFININTAEEIFPVRITQTGDYVIVLPDTADTAFLSALVKGFPLN